MAELERALTQAGYTVSSWRVLANDMAAHGVTATDAGRQLGAEVLFQVNSLERVKTPRGEGARWERTFYQSNNCGDAVQPASMDDLQLAQLRKQSQGREQEVLQGKQRLGATLNVNAIMVETGQTIWFYQWTKFDAPGGELDVRVLSELTGNMQWSVVSPQCSSLYAARSMKGNPRESDATGVTAGSEEKPLYFKLMREVVKDFVAQFAKGAGSTAGQRTE